ncbi:hypothetical protein GCM10027262_77540 [Nocardia tengchongensis]
MSPRKTIRTVRCALRPRRAAAASMCVRAYCFPMAAARVWSLTSTTPTEEDAQKIARTVVAERLAAGAEVTGPAMSVFWHNDELGEGQEWRVTLKTSAAAKDRLAERILELHPWAGGPEIIASPVEWAIERYADWVEKFTAASQ